MDVPQLILIAIVTALAVAAIAWFGPRSKQWRTNDGRPTEEAAPLRTLTDGGEDDEADLRPDERHDPEPEDDYRQNPPPEGPDS
jgi:hypothetical protein